MLVYWLWLQNLDHAEWKIPALGASFISCVKCRHVFTRHFFFFLDIGFFSARITVMLVYWLWLQNPDHAEWKIPELSIIGSHNFDLLTFRLLTNCLKNNVVEYRKMRFDLQIPQSDPILTYNK